MEKAYALPGVIFTNEWGYSEKRYQVRQLSELDTKILVVTLGAQRASVVKQLLQVRYGACSAVVINYDHKSKPPLSADYILFEKLLKLSCNYQDSYVDLQAGEGKDIQLSELEVKIIISVLGPLACSDIVKLLTDKFPEMGCVYKKSFGKHDTADYNIYTLLLEAVQEEESDAKYTILLDAAVSAEEEC